MYIRCIVSPDRGRNNAVIKQPFTNSQLIAGGAAHEHNIHQTLLNHLPNCLSVLIQRTEGKTRFPRAGIQTRRCDAQSHIRVFGVGDYKMLSESVSGQRGELLIKYFLQELSLF